MPLYPYRLYCQKIDRSRNLARYYTLAIEPTLLGDVAVVRNWGRIGKCGGQKSEIFATERDAVFRFLELARKKRQRGYRPVASSKSVGDCRVGELQRLKESNLRP
ncbi:WGR domain-containing protein [Rhizobium sp. TRM95796]|uniref:WGR domain-containing protein n=1 Tax=Rhizobium sp. TRM95796 TaxID=2979862 RepID=UPI0021E7B32D|nr:WGR domain-containing protein [Rhizobium sp. TRM95796]MCV3768891.1 WGR domain-containing protein [Rhizobium sp. TRM95796]